MSLFHEFEKRLDEKLRAVFRSGEASTDGREIIEVQRFLLDRVAERVQILPRARRVFPFNELLVRIPVANPEKRTAFEMVFAVEGAFEQDVRDYLQKDGVEFPPDLQAQVTLTDSSEITDPLVTFRIVPKSGAKASPSAEPPASIRFTIVDTGSAIQVGKSRIHLGRTGEVLDGQRRPVRRNDVVVDDSTVSRAHAHIEWDAASSEYRLFDDGSSYGTGVIHEGKLVSVPPGGRGVRIAPGDELYLGQVRVRVDAL